MFQEIKYFFARIYEDESGLMQYYVDDCYACDMCSKEEE